MSRGKRGDAWDRPIGQQAQDFARAGVRTMASPVTKLTSTPRRVAKVVVRAASSGFIKACGVDATEQLSARDTLIVTPHPDDETLGCGATIARMRSQGVSVKVLFVTGGGRSPAAPGAAIVELRRSEAIRAMSILGVGREALRFLDYPDGALSDSCEDVAQEVLETIRSTSVTQVMVTSAKDRHPDHAAVARATRLAVSRSVPPVRLYEYPIWQRVPALTVAGELMRTGWGWPLNGRHAAQSRPKLVLTDDYLARKREAIAAYASQLPHFPVGFVDDFLGPHETFVEALPTN